ncbi:MAG: hypothetical protein ACXWFS_11310 [Thermoanaerobaculia bacterium]
MKPIRIPAERVTPRPHSAVSPIDLRRAFRLDVPLFSPVSAWNQSADHAPVLPSSDEQIGELYRVLLGDATSLRPRALAPPAPYPFPLVNYDDGSIPLFRAGNGAAEIRLRSYLGRATSANPKIAARESRTVLPAPAGPVRPAGPEGPDGEGFLVLIDQLSGMEWDLRQAATDLDPRTATSRGGGRSGTSILAAGSIDRFYLGGSGSNPPAFYGPRAAGTPLLAGLLLPEDVERGSIDHALAFAVPGLRNLNRENPAEAFSSDVVYPAATTERELISTSRSAIAAGQRIRLRTVVVGEDGIEIDDAFFAPITRMVLTALRRYGAYAVDAAPALTFYAEDVHTARIDLDPARINFLLGRPALAQLPSSDLHWRLLMERLSEDLAIVPFAAGRWWEFGTGRRDPRAARASVANFEMVAPPRPGLLRRR